jgi:hypothetical protein
MRARIDLWLPFALTLLAGFGVLGTWNGLTQFDQTSTGLQFLATITETGYGITGLAAIPALLTGWRGLRTILYLWLVSLSLTGGLAPVAWGEQGIGAGIASLILAAVVGLTVMWVVRRAAVT